jgi:hypothetical protein
MFTRSELQRIIDDGPMQSWAVYVTTKGDFGFYTTNGIRYATMKEAIDSGSELSGRWFAVADVMAAPSEDEITHKFENGQSVKVNV